MSLCSRKVGSHAPIAIRSLGDGPVYRGVGGVHGDRVVLCMRSVSKTESALSML
jgi:hypothetical protein